LSAGRLEDHNVADLLRSLALSRASGKLTFTRRDAHALLAFRAGRIIYAASSALRETFGSILVLRGLLNEADLMEALERQHNAKRPTRLGNVLVGMGKTDEKALRDKVAADAKLKESYGDAWDRVAASVTAHKDIYYRHSLLEGARSAAGFNSELFEKARMLVRLADESRKPNAERLREYGEAGLESLKQQLFSKAEIYSDLEIVKLGDSLGMLLELLGTDNDLVEKVLAGKSPQQRATELVLGSKLADADLCKKLADGGVKTLLLPPDALIGRYLARDDASHLVMIGAGTLPWSRHPGSGRFR
jgi:hypothetical protein